MSVKISSAFDLSASRSYYNMATTKDVEMTEKKTPDDPHARIDRSNSRSDEAMSKRANKGGGFGTDRYVYFFYNNQLSFCFCQNVGSNILYNQLFLFRIYI